MGVTIAKLFTKLFSNTEMRILMVGLDAAGKTTILYQLKLGEVIKTTPTIGFHVETVEYKNVNFTVWDVGGQEYIRPLWRHYYEGTQGIIFVIDSSDTSRINEAKDELYGLLEEEELKNAILLIFANKNDLPDAMSIETISEKLALSSIKHQWYIQSSCATKGEGLYEGLEWLTKQLK
eukprot:Anaeramoba_ignava/a6298_91.p1 GENE.a6298_91~~a6298_91.p1  ORF type:complete len:187 (-),score=44.89 a6298_91:108-641(-)